MKRSAPIAAALLACGLVTTAAAPLPALNARPVPLKEGLHEGDSVEHIRFLGMLAIPNVYVNGLRFAQLSGLAWDDDDQVLYAISDKGALFHLRPVFRDGLLIDVRLSAAVPLLGLTTGRRLSGVYADSEGLDVVNGRNHRPGDAELLVSFERRPRILRYRTDGHALTEHPLPAPLNDARAYRNDNNMLEAVCMDPTLGILTTPESPLKSDSSQIRIMSLDGRSWLYTPENASRVVALECLGDGELVVLERDYGRLFWRSSITLKRARLPAATATPPRVERLVTLNTADGFQIDNFEGLARHRGNRFFLVSDNNDLFVQRTLLLYIEVVER